MDSIKTQQGQRQRLPGPGMQVGTGAPQRLLVQRGGPTRGAAQPLVQALELSHVTL
jgi:hypothetical protein